MKIHIMNLILLLVLLICKKIDCAKDGYIETNKPTTSLNAESDTPTILRLHQNGIEDVNRSIKLTDGNLSRVKRQYSYDPYYNSYYPYPVPIIIGGGLGFGGFGGRGFGGTGFGGRGFGGQGNGGFGGRGNGGGGHGGGGHGGGGGGHGGGGRG